MRALQAFPRLVVANLRAWLPSLRLQLATMLSMWLVYAYALVPSIAGPLQSVVPRYTVYAVTGLLTAVSAQIAMVCGATLWMERRAGVLEEIVAEVCSLRLYALSRITAFGAVSAAIYSVLCAASIPLLGPRAVEALACVPIVVALSMVWSSLAILASLLLRGGELYALVSSIIAAPSILVSPALYPLQSMPWPLRALALINPNTYAIELTRALTAQPHTLALGICCGALLGALIALTTIVIAVCRDELSLP